MTGSGFFDLDRPFYLGKSATFWGVFLFEHLIKSESFEAKFLDIVEDPVFVSLLDFIIVIAIGGELQGIGKFVE